MSTVAVIGFGVLTWVVLSVLLAFLIGRTIQLRDRQRPDRSPPVELSATDRAGTVSPPQPSGRDSRDEF